MYPQTFMEKIYSHITINDNTCWIWNGTVNNSGYGVVQYNNKTCPVHRILFEHHYKQYIPTRYHIHHAICENKRCVRYDHLVATTAQMNCLLKSPFVDLRKYRFAQLQYHSPIVTTTEIAHVFGMKRENVVPYLKGSSETYEDFTFKRVQKGRGPKPAVFKLIFAPGFFERLEEPEKEWRDQPAFSPLTYPVAIAV